MFKHELFTCVYYVCDLHNMKRSNYYIGIVIVIHGCIMLHFVTYCYKIVLLYMKALSAIMDQRQLSR